MTTTTSTTTMMDSSSALVAPLLIASGEQGDEEDNNNTTATMMMNNNNNNSVVFSCRSSNYKIFWRVYIMQAGMWGTLPWIISGDWASTSAHDKATASLVCIGIISLAFFIILLRCPTMIELTHGGTLVLRRYFNNDVVFSQGKVVATHANSDIFWAGSLALLCTDYTTGIADRVVVTLAGRGTQILICPDDVQGFLRAVEESINSHQQSTTTSNSNDGAAAATSVEMSNEELV